MFVVAGRGGRWIMTKLHPDGGAEVYRLAAVGAGRFVARTALGDLLVDFFTESGGPPQYLLFEDRIARRRGELVPESHAVSSQ
jgi:hypothetical protein